MKQQALSAQTTSTVTEEFGRCHKHALIHDDTPVTVLALQISLKTFCTGDSKEHGLLSGLGGLVEAQWLKVNGKI